MTISNTAQFRELVGDGTLEQIGSGFTFTEGPVWNRWQNHLLFSDMPGDVRRRYTPGEGVVEVMRPSNKGNGMTYDANGDLLVCEHATSTVVRETTTGERVTIASHYEGKELNSPNDVIIAEDGSVYFSDPIFGRVPVFGVERQQDLDFQGVFRIPPGGGELELIDSDYTQPNGLCFSPGETRLYVNDSFQALIRAYDVAPDRSLGTSSVFCDKIGDGVVENGIPDGMKCDELGNIWVTGPGGIWVLDPGGQVIGLLEVPENVGNLNWGDDDWRTLYICASTSLYRIRLHVGGNRLPYMR